MIDIFAKLDRLKEDLRIKTRRVENISMEIERIKEEIDKLEGLKPVDENDDLNRIIREHPSKVLSRAVRVLNVKFNIYTLSQLKSCGITKKIFMRGEGIGQKTMSDLDNVLKEYYNIKLN